MLHELGHLFDIRVMNNGDRARFRKVMRKPRRRWWAGKRPLAEQFAKAYSFCARYTRPVAIGRYASYGYSPTRGQQRTGLRPDRRRCRGSRPCRAARHMSLR